MKLPRHSTACNLAYTQFMSSVDAAPCGDSELDERVLDELDAARERLCEMGLAAAPSCPACRASAAEQGGKRGDYEL